MKAVWKGAIAFGLVNIPVKLYSAVEPQAIGFRILCKDCHTPLKYKRYCPSCKKEVEWQNVVKGVEVKKGAFYVITPEELKSLRPEKTDIIEIVEFVGLGQIDSIYFDKHYYVVPEKVKEKAYFLFHEVLSATAKQAIGRFVMREKEHTCVISPYRNGLLLTTLNYVYEIRDIAKIEELKEAPKLGREEMKLAKELIARMYEKEFVMKQFKDTFAEKLKELLLKKIKGEKVVVKAAKPREEKGLMEALKASVKAK